MKIPVLFFLSPASSPYKQRRAAQDRIREHIKIKVILHPVARDLMSQADILVFVQQPPTTIAALLYS